jgi:hypothetical protein
VQSLLHTTKFYTSYRLVLFLFDFLTVCCCGCSHNKRSQGLFTFDMIGSESSEKNKLTKVFCCRSKIRPRSLNTGVEGGRELRES